MAPKPLTPDAARAPRSGDAAEDRARAAQAADLGGVLGAPLVKARKYARRVSLTSATPKTIAHGLGRELAGWLLTDPTTAALVRRVSKDDRTLVLESTGDVEGDLWLW